MILLITLMSIRTQALSGGYKRTGIRNWKTADYSGPACRSLHQTALHTPNALTISLCSVSISQYSRSIQRIFTTKHTGSALDLRDQMRCIYYRRLCVLALRQLCIPLLSRKGVKPLDSDHFQFLVIKDICTMLSFYMFRIVFTSDL